MKNLWSPVPLLVMTAAAMMAIHGVAEAQTAQTSFAVTANVVANCTITASPLAFGSYDPVGTHAATPLDGTSTVTITCTRGSTGLIGLDLGTNPTGAVRRLASAGEFLNYELYKDAAHTAIWGNAGTDRLDPGPAPSRAPRAFTVHGRIAGGQDAVTGAYADTIVATVTF